MNVERGEYFVVTRGFELLGPSMVRSVLFGEELEPWKEQRDDKPQHDRSMEGVVFEAVEVCGAMIAARVVVQRSTYAGCYPLGKCASINTTEVEVWPVTKAYVEALRCT
jgi:hypothetical protein